MSSDVDFAVLLSTFGAHATPERFRRVATTAEELGFDAVWAGDHVAFPAEIPDEYPFSPDGRSPFHVTDDAYDVFTVLSYLAGVTEDIGLGTNTCVVPYRHPVVLARNALSLEQLTDHRFDFGVGVGWMETEFEALDVPFDERGERTDEFLELFERARERGECDFDGTHHSFQKLGFHPTPPQDRPKIWIGGRSGEAFRRVAEYGDGWTIFWDRPQAVASAKKRIDAAWRDYERTGRPEIALTRPIDIGPGQQRSADRPLVGDPDDVLDDVAAYSDAGVTRIVVDFYTTDIDEQLSQLRAFGERVIPHV